MRSDQEARDDFYAFVRAYWGPEYREPEWLKQIGAYIDELQGGQGYRDEGCEVVPLDGLKGAYAVHFPEDTRCVQESKYWDV